MSRPLAPSMPTAAQVREALALAREANPAAYIKRLGPDGIEFCYPGSGGTDDIDAMIGRAR